MQETWAIYAFENINSVVFLFLRCFCFISSFVDMSTQSKKLLVVLGATGNQGGSIIRSYLSKPPLQSEWHIRGITRDTSSPSSLTLSASGIDMVAGTLDDPDSLVAAFANATAIFAVTDFWQPMRDPSSTQHAKTHNLDLAAYAQQIEEKWGSNIITAATQIPTLKHFIFSSLPPVRLLTSGKLTHVRHFDGKAAIISSIRRSHPSLWSITSQLMIGHYTSNILPGSFFSPSYNPSTQRFEMQGAMSSSDLIPYIDTPRSTGPFFWSLLLHEPAGTVLVAFDEMRSRAGTCEILSRVTGKRFGFVQKSVEEMARGHGFGMEGAESGAWTGQYGFFGEKITGEWREGLTFPKNLEDKVEVRGLEEWIGEQDWSEVLKQEETKGGRVG